MLREMSKEETASELFDECVRRGTLITELKDALRDCTTLAAALMGGISGRDGVPYPSNHKEIINRAQRLLGGRELS